MPIKYCLCIVVLMSCRAANIVTYNQVNGVEYWVESSDTLCVVFAGHQNIPVCDENSCYHEYFVRDLQNKDLLMVLTPNKLSSVKDTLQLVIYNKTLFNDSLFRAPVYERIGRDYVLSRNYSLEHKIAFGDLRD